MLKHLFTSKARVKLLTTFLLNPDGEFFIRELTRRLDEQINSVRRELANLKKMGLLRSKLKNRKKYYLVNKQFILFNELRSIIIKSINSKENIVKGLSELGNIQFLLMGGIFVEKNSPVDLLLVGDIDKQKLEEFLNTQVETKRPIRFSTLAAEDFIYRLKCHDKFVTDLVNDTDNIVAINKLEGKMESE